MCLGVQGEKIAHEDEHPQRNWYLKICQISHRTKLDSIAIRLVDGIKETFNQVKTFLSKHKALVIKALRIVSGPLRGNTFFEAKYLRDTLKI